MKLLYDGSAIASVPVSFEDATTVKVIIQGLLVADKTDRVLGLQINGRTEGYRSYVVQDGDHKEGRKETTCFALGRTGWHLDAHVAVDYTFYAQPQILGIGQTNFFLKDRDDNGILFCGDSRGALMLATTLKSVTLVTSGAPFNGVMKVYSL